MIYSDYVVRFGSEAPDGVHMIVETPCGSASGLFQPPPNLQRAHILLPGLWRDLRSPRQLYPEPPSLLQVGSELFKAIFNGHAGSLFEQSMSLIKDQDQGLRIKLIFDLAHKGLDDLQTFPWEFIYRAETQSFLALNRHTPIVRFIQLPRLSNPVRLSRLKVLLASPQIKGLPQLQAKEECERIERALAPLPSVEVIHLNYPTVTALREALLTQEINVLHFAGSAGLMKTGDAFLFFENENGEPALIRGDELALLLFNTPSVRLVFLNACDTAKVVGSGGINPFRSIATALVASGVPAVIGMQFPISDPAALHFGEIFYQRLASGDPIDIAVTEGRRAVYIRDSNTMEWGTPVLYSRISDGALFGDLNDPSPSQSRLTVFLCHASEDKAFIRELYRKLMLEGYDVWLDEEKILPGQAWEPEIKRALRNSHAVIVCLSKNSLTKTGYVQQEIAMALDLLQQQPENSIFVIPVKIEECKTPDRLSHLHFVRADEERGYERLLAALKQRARDLQLGP